MFHGYWLWLRLTGKLQFIETFPYFLFVLLLHQPRKLLYVFAPVRLLVCQLVEWFVYAKNF